MFIGRYFYIGRDEMMKCKKRKNKAILIVALILCITIGYAALATTLNITGNSEIKNARWDIHFDNLVVDSSSVEATTPATIDSNKTTINYASDGTTINSVTDGSNKKILLQQTAGSDTKYIR